MNTPIPTDEGLVIKPRYRCVFVEATKPLIEHPSIRGIRNKRHRRRTYKKYKRIGIETFSVRGFDVFPDGSSQD